MSQIFNADRRGWKFKHHFFHSTNGIDFFLGVFVIIAKTSDTLLSLFIDVFF